MMRELYADNYPQRRMEALIRSGGQCEHIIDGQHCPNRLGVFKISRVGNAFLSSCSFTTPIMIPGIQKQSCWLSVRGVICGYIANRSKMERFCRGSKATE